MSHLRHRMWIVALLTCLAVGCSSTPTTTNGADTPVATSTPTATAMGSRSGLTVAVQD